MPHEFAVPLPPECQGRRLDQVLASLLKERGLSRTRLQQLIHQGRVRIDDRTIMDAAAPVRGSLARITVPAPEPARPAPQSLPLTVIYEDHDLLVIDKPPGMVVHPAPGHRDQTLVNALLAYCGDSLSGIGGVARPGIVHRLDKDTSGLLAVAKHDRAHHILSAQFAARSLSRIYQAFVWGTPQPPHGTIDAPVGRDPRNRQRMAVTPKSGKHAVTHYKTAETYGARASLLTCKLETGRTHQIRVHLARLGHGVIGDPLYGKPRAGDDLLVRLLRRFPRQALHAAVLGFQHPVTQKVLRFESVLPEDFSETYLALKGLVGVGRGS